MGIEPTRSRAPAFQSEFSDRSKAALHCPEMPSGFRSFEALADCWLAASHMDDSMAVCAHA